jgi:hypothetical protein
MRHNSRRRELQVRSDRNDRAGSSCANIAADSKNERCQLDAQTEIDKVTEWLFEASRHVPEQYMQLPVAGAETGVYRERVYCYELYHQWRARWSADSPFTLSAEVDKSGHPIIRDKFKPDFVVHVPGEMDNLLVMEVKPANAGMSGMVKDLKSLFKFRCDLGEGKNYRAAYFWIYGLRIDRWPDIRHELSRSVAALKIDPAAFRFVVHETANARAQFVDWL